MSRENCLPHLGIGAIGFNPRLKTSWYLRQRTIIELFVLAWRIIKCYTVTLMT